MASDDIREDFRQPLRFAPKQYSFYVLLAVIFPLIEAFILLFNSHGVWKKALGALLLVLVASEIALFVRWFQRPTDRDR